MIFDKVLNSIDEGRNGGNEGIPMGFPRLSNIIPNIQKSRYITITGGSGSGKSSFADTAYIFNPLDWYMENKDKTDIKLHINYFSFEISEERIISKQIARKIYKDTNLILDVNYILSFGKNRISQEHYDLVKKYKNYFDSIEEYLTIYGTEGHNPTGIRKTLLKYAENNGVFEKDGERLVYRESNPNLYTLNVFDHARLAPREQGFNVKENIDKLSEYLLWTRNYCKFTNILLAQTNRNIGNIERRKLEGEDLTMSLDDISDSSNIAQDSDMVLGIINPHKYGLGSYRRYNIEKLQNRARFLQILKNRDGEADGTLGMLFIGENGFFKELPRVEDMNDLIYNSIRNLKSSI